MNEQHSTEQRSTASAEPALERPVSHDAPGVVIEQRAYAWGPAEPRSARFFTGNAWGPKRS